MRTVCILGRENARARARTHTHTHTHTHSHTHPPAQRPNHGQVLDACGRAIAPGVTCTEIDRVCHDASVERKCYPSPLNYMEFPKSCCTSVNEIICHGIPDDRPLEEGDIVNVDISVYHNGYHADLNETFLVGKVDAESYVAPPPPYVNSA
jgi:Xaa-Pro aminopeptidase